jgi:DNA excision repair protein ERCC-4
MNWCTACHDALAACCTQGFLRAFSDNPNAFASGFNRIEKVMKALRVRRLLLFPRFHQTVKDSLEAHAPEVGLYWKGLPRKIAHLCTAFAGLVRWSLPRMWRAATQVEHH